MDKVNKETEGISIHGVIFRNLTFADDIDMIEEDEEMLEGIVNELSEEGKRYGLLLLILTR